MLIWLADFARILRLLSGHWATRWGFVAQWNLDARRQVSARTADPAQQVTARPGSGVLPSCTWRSWGSRSRGRTSGSTFPGLSEWTAWWRSTATGRSPNSVRRRRGDALERLIAEGRVSGRCAAVFRTARTLSATTAAARGEGFAADQVATRHLWQPRSRSGQALRYAARCRREPAQ